MKYNRTELNGGIGFTTVTDCKFKTNALRVKLITEMDSNAAANSIAAGVLSVSSKNYDTLAKLNAKLAELYGSSIYTETKKRGDLQILSLGASWLDNKYALEGEDIAGEALDTVLDCLFSPNADNRSFDKVSFGITKKDLLDKIDSEINEKRSYAINKAAEYAYKDEPAALPCNGTREEAEAVTPEKAYDAYVNLLRTAQIEIFLVTPEESPAAEEKIKKAFARLNRNNTVRHKFTEPSPVKDEPINVTEKLDVNQSKLVMVFKSQNPDTNTAALKYLSVIYGETPFSKLFSNVREKLSLCYYCKSMYVNSKNVLFVDSGVEFGNIEKAEAEIIAQLEDIKNGNFSDDEMSDSLRSIENSLKGVGDTASSYIGWYFGRFCEGDSLSPQEILEKYRTVTKEDIMSAASSLRLDTVYILTGEDNE